MRKLILIVCLGLGLHAATIDCEKAYSQFEKLVKSDSCQDNKKAVSLLLTMDGNRCKSIGSDGEYELELLLVKKLEKCGY